MMHTGDDMSFNNILQSLITQAREVMNKLPDTRKKSNATKYEISDAVMGGLSVFLMQDPSFLSHQERLLESSGGDNFTTLFSGANIPSPNQIRNLLDNISPSGLFPILDFSLQTLEKKDRLKEFQYFEGGYLIALDGTEYHSSENIKCECCSTRTYGKKTDKQKTIYHHQMLAASIVSPGINQAIPLRPEFISPQDGSEKQDSEMSAAKRWIEKNCEIYKHLNPTIMGDDLYSKEPICKDILEKEMNFLFTCKPESHKTLYEYVKTDEVKKLSIKEKEGYKTYIYNFKYMNSVPIKDGDDALLVNWLDIEVVNPKDSKVVYHSSFITSHHITNSNVSSLANAGRARWKIENENNNTLKTKGYNFEHNYGHGKKNLSTVFATLTIIAFAFHTVSDIACELYERAKKKSRTRINFFDRLRTLTSFICFKSWESLLNFIINPPPKEVIGVY
jgi:hypothetical protein